jgi:hypothetical protein
MIESSSHSLYYLAVLGISDKLRLTLRELVQQSEETS